MRIKKEICTVTVDKIMVILCVIPAVTFGLAIIQDDSTLSDNSVRIFFRILNYLCMTGFLTLSLAKRKVLKISVLLAIMPVIYWLIYFLHAYIQPSINFLVMIMLILFSLTDKKIKCNIYKVYYKFIVIMAALGIIVFLLYYFKMAFPYERIKYYVLSDDASYFNYKIGYLYVSNTTGVARLCGLFNEPGYFGTIIAFSLCIEELNMKKISNIILLVAGCFTLSLAFLFILILYIIISSVKKPFRLFCLILLFCIAFFLLQNIEIKNDEINTVLDRLSVNEKGQLAGNNRSTPFLDREIKRMLTNWDYRLFFGYGTGYSLTLPNAGLGYKIYLLHYGLVGLAIIYGMPFLMACYLSKKNSTCAVEI